MRSFLCSQALLLALLTGLSGCASPSGTSDDETGAADADLTSIPASGTFEAVDKPYSGSYVARITLSAQKHFAIDLVVRSSSGGSWWSSSETSERTIVQKGETYNIFMDEGRRIIAFHVIHEEEEDRANGVVVYELKSASSTSIELAPVGTNDTFELRRKTAP